MRIDKQSQELEVLDTPETFDNTSTPLDFKKHGKEKFLPLPEEDNILVLKSDKVPTLEQIVGYLQAIHAAGTFSSSGSIIKGYKAYKILNRTSVLPIALMILCGTEGSSYSGYDFEQVADIGKDLELHDFYSALESSTSDIKGTFDWAALGWQLQQTIPLDQWEDNANAYVMNNDALLGSKAFDDLFPIMATLSGNSHVGLAFSIVNGIFSVAKGVLDVVNPIIPILELTQHVLNPETINTVSDSKLEDMWDSIPESFKVIYGLPTLQAFQDELLGAAKPIIDNVRLTTDVTLFAMQTAKNVCDPIYAPRKAVSKAWEKLGQFHQKSGRIIFRDGGIPLPGFRVDNTDEMLSLIDYLKIYFPEKEMRGLEKKEHDIIFRQDDSSKSKDLEVEESKFIPPKPNRKSDKYIFF